MKKIPNVQLDFEPRANMIFAHWTRAAHQRLHAAGALYEVRAGDHTNGPLDEFLPARLVTDWSTSAESVEQFLNILQG